MLKRNKLLLFIPVTLVLILFILFIQSKVKQKKVDTNLQVNTENGLENENIVSSQTLPAVFPDDFPLYPETTLIESWTKKSKNNVGISVLWESKDKPSKIYTFYSENLVNNGWDLKKISGSDSPSTLSFSKGETSGFLGLTKSDSGKTAISVTMGMRIK